MWCLSGQPRQRASSLHNQREFSLACKLSHRQTPLLRVSRLFLDYIIFLYVRHTTYPGVDSILTNFQTGLDPVLFLIFVKTYKKQTKKEYGNHTVTICLVVFTLSKKINWYICFSRSSRTMGNGNFFSSLKF